MQVIEYLKSYGLDKLKEEYAIKTTEHKYLPLLTFNYCQINSPRFHPITRECRGLILEKDTWKVIGRSFERFFNYGESKQEDEKLHWNNCNYYEKHDGSLMTMFWYKGEWMIATKGSFADGNPSNLVDKSWKQLFFENTNIPTPYLCPQYSYVFEFCSKYNKVVRLYEKPQVYLLAAKANDAKDEYYDDELMSLSNITGTPVPEKYEFESPTHAMKFLEDKDGSFEGFVIKDHKFDRIKLKNKKYVSLHQLKNSTGITKNNLIKFALAKNGEEYELLTYFPEYKDEYYALKDKINLYEENLRSIWKDVCDIENQKEFALAIKNHTNDIAGKLSPFLFMAKRQQVHPIIVWDERKESFLEKS